jgi:hypothetical protein
LSVKKVFIIRRTEKTRLLSRRTHTFSSVGIENSNFRNQEPNFQQDYGLPNSSGVQQQPDILQGPSINMPFQSYSSDPPSTVTQPPPSKQPALQINTNTPPDLISIQQYIHDGKIKQSSTKTRYSKRLAYSVSLMKLAVMSSFPNYPVIIFLIYQLKK